MNSKTKVNKQYKDRLFRLLFGSLDMADNIVSLYNALNSTAYGKDDIEDITTIDDVIYIKMKNDVSFLLDDYMNLWEQQSSFNPNMPVRGLMYYGNLFSQYIDKSGESIYGSRLIQLPTPKYIVFYNGPADRPPVEKLKLSDAFIHPDNSSEFEWTATVYNLNKGKNDHLLHLCKPLGDYMTLIGYIREYQTEGLDPKDAVDQAVQRCIAENILSSFLTKHRAEVMDVCITEFNEKAYVDSIRREGRAEERTLFMKVIDRVKKGDTPEQIIASGVPKEVVDLVMTLRN